MEKIITSDESETLEYLLDLLNSEAHHVVAVSVPDSNMMVRLWQLFQHYTKIHPQFPYCRPNSSLVKTYLPPCLGAHFFIGNNLVIFLELDDAYYDFQNVTEYVRFAPPALRTKRLQCDKCGRHVNQELGVFYPRCTYKGGCEGTYVQAFD